MAQKKVIVLSLGQIANSDESKSVQAFIDQLANEGKWFPGLRVWLAMIWDKIWHHTIDDYKTGKIDTDAFYDRLKNQLGGTLSKDTFLRCWNKMCEISDDSIAALQDTLEAIKDKDVTLCVISSTNPAQKEYILRQLHDKGIDTSSIEFVTSYEQGKLDIRALAKDALQGYNTADHEIISLHNQLTNPTQLGVPHAQFTYTPFDTRVKGASLSATVCKELGVELPARGEGKEPTASTPLLAPEEGRGSRAPLIREGRGNTGAGIRI